jgi:2,3-bisphosphoglycerate-dependent phosphoglycerate mutase
VLLRHGQSETNAVEQFTGWIDTPLTVTGEQQARHAGALLRSGGVAPDVVHTSVLRRSIRTAEIVLDTLDRSWLPVVRSWRLNERQYGALAGRTKSDVRAEVGDEQYRRWRRGFLEAPPPASAEHLRALADDPRYAALPAHVIPSAESLADVLARVLPHWVDTISADLRAGRTTLVVAHGNSLRALVTHLDQLDEDAVATLNIPTGMPLCYELDERLRPLYPHGRYLDPSAAAEAAAAVAGEGLR